VLTRPERSVVINLAKFAQITSMAIQKISRSSFGIKQLRYPVPNLNSFQIDSFKLFFEEELNQILKEFSGVEDPVSGRFKIHFGPKFYLENLDKDEYVALLNGSSYGADLFIDVGLEVTGTKTKKTQKVFVGKIPMMNRRGSFIVNGTQKVVAGQLVKSPGVLFKREAVKGIVEYVAKIIPNRGSWVDIVIGKSGAIYVKIDKKKKFPLTQLLKVYGVVTEADMRALFTDVDKDDRISYIDETIAKDTSSSIEEAVSSIYRKLRPGDIISVQQGRDYIRGLFEDADKYDFGAVGRYKFDLRVKKERNENMFEYKKILTFEEIVGVVKELINMKINNFPSDEIDSLSNRRIRTVSEWLGKTFRAGFARVVRNIREKMINLEGEVGTPAQLVNMRPLAAMVEDFFNTSQLSRFMDQTNFMSEMDDRQFLTSSGPGGITKERAGFEVRDVHPSHYGRLCPLNTPEGPAFGLNVHLAMYARVNKMGFLESPYKLVKHAIGVTEKDIVDRISLKDVVIDKKKIVKAGDVLTKDVVEQLKKLDKELVVQVAPYVSDEVKYLTADEELASVVGEINQFVDDQGHFTVPMIGGRIYGNPTQVNVSELQYVDVSAAQILSISSTLIPFLSQSESFRVVVGTNQQGQALPLVRPENPIVGTGYEAVAARDSGYAEFSPVDGEVIEADGSKVIVQSKETNEKFVFKTVKYLPSNNHSAINQRVTVAQGEKVKKGDILIEGFGVHNGEFGVGQNVRVAFMPFKGYNFEDAIVLSDRLLKNNKFTSVHIYELQCDLHETRLGNEEFTRDIPNIPLEKLSKLDKDGVVHVGAYVESGDLLVGKITPKGEVDLSPEDKLIRVLFGEYSKDVKNSSLYLEHGLSGKVISVRTLSREKQDPLPSDVIRRVHIWLATTRQIKVGDKMAGRHGNKGVVAMVMPQADMPYTKDGHPIDMVLNPLSVIGRMNLGQLLETHLGLVVSKTGAHTVTQPLNDIPAGQISDLLVEAGFSPDGKMDLWDGQTGEQFDRPVVVGSIYFNKLHHLVDDKFHARSTGPYSLVTQQPLGGRSNSGGQRFGEMEVWALEAYGAAHALQEMITIKSDDVKGREKAFESIIKGKQVMEPNLPGSFIVLANELTALGLKVNLDAERTEEKMLDEKLALSVDTGDLAR
jgi:DNA-directed RNA polymerase subunit beta